MNVGPYNLFPHQQKSVHQLGDALRRLRKKWVILQGICGFGKTVVSTYLIQEFLKTNRRVAFVAFGRTLIFQKSDTLSECEIGHAVMMAQCGKFIQEPWAVPHHAEETQASVYVVSKSTYTKRLASKSVERLDVDVWIVDEAHLATSRDWADILKDARMVIGLTGTPALGNGNGLGGHGWKEIVVAATHKELLEGGYIVPFRYFNPWTVDTSDIQIGANGEFVQQQVDGKFNHADLTGHGLRDMYDVHKKIGETEIRPFVVYASSVAHSIAIAKQYGEGDGLFCKPLKVEHIDADTGPAERKRMYKALINRDINGLSNFGVLRIGWDCPMVSCLQLLVAMYSLNSYLQTCGRGQRPFPGKKDCLILDHGNNIGRHQWPQADRPWCLDATANVNEAFERNRPEDAKDRTCSKCHNVFPAKLKVCPQCGHTKVRHGTLVRMASGELVEIEPPKVKVKRTYCDGQKLWNNLYFKSKHSKSDRAKTFNVLKAEFERSAPSWRIEVGKVTTRVVCDQTGENYKLGYCPKPDSVHWSRQVKHVGSEALQWSEAVDVKEDSSEGWAF